MNKIKLDVVNPTFEEGKAVYTCLELVDRCLNMHKYNIKLNCVDDEYEDFNVELCNEFENLDYCVMKEELRDPNARRRCEIKFNEITEIILNMFEEEDV